MEQKDGMPQNVGHDREGFSKRRLSSILKAPRMSMKVCGIEQDENQDETRPIEKPRNSRRVSFATTSNVRVFPKDLKAEPVLAPIQKLAPGASEGQNERTQSFDTSVKQGLMGLDTMLTQPIQFELNKENFFPDSSLPVDRTLLLGEDTGCMDMTYSHTVLLEKEEEPCSDFTLSSITESYKLNLPTGLPRQTFNSVENGEIQSQFDEFLASLSKPGAQNVPEKNNRQVLMENISKIREEKVPASCYTEAEHLERDDMDITDIHPVMTDEVFQQFPYSVGSDTTSCTNYLDDMELTRNQTQTLSLKGLVKTNPSIPDPDQRKCTFVCDDPSEMILTEVLDEYVQDQKELSEQNHFQSSASFAPGTPYDQKMVSGLQTAVGKISMSLAAHDQSDLMELTCQASTERNNLAVVSKLNPEMYAMVSKPQTSSISQLPNPGKNVKSVGLYSTACDDMDLTGRTVCGDVDLKCRTVCGDVDLTRRTVCDMDLTGRTVCGDMDLTGRTVCGDMDLTGRTVCDDMDLTRRTVCDDMDLTRRTVCDGVDLTGRTVCDDMDLTGRTVCDDMDLTRRTVCDDMDLTGRTVCDDMDLTGRTVCDDMDLTRRTVCDDMDLTRRTVCDGVDLTGRTVCDDMDLTGRTVCDDMDLTRRTVCDDMDLTGRTVCDDMDLTGRTVCDDVDLTRRTVCDDMDLTSRTVCDDMDLTGRTVCGDMDLTGRTVCDDMDLKRRTVCDMDLKRRTVCGDMDLTGRTVCDDMDLKRRTVCGDMDLTRRTVCGDMDLKRRTVCGDMDLTHQTVCGDMDLTGRTVFDMDLTRRTVYGDVDLKRRTVCGDMDLTHQTVCGDMDLTGRTVCGDMNLMLCQTVGEIKSCDDYKPLGTSKKRLSHVSTSFQTGHGVASGHVGRMDLNRYSFSKRTKTDNYVEPTTHRSLPQDLSNHTETQQDIACDVMHIDMELTGLKTFPIETSPSNKTSSAAGGISSRATAHQMKRSEVAHEKLGTGHKSIISVMDLAAENLEDTTRDQTTDSPKNFKPGQSKERSEEDCNLVITAALENQCVDYSQNDSCVTKESDSDSLKMEHCSSDKCRRRSLADLQAKLKNISQFIRESNALTVGSVTAPLVSFTAVSPVEKHSELQNSLQTSQETQLHGNKINIPSKEATTPFQLKNSLMARLSVSGIKPKFPPRAASIHPNQTELESINSLQNLPAQTFFSAKVQNGSYETNLIDEVLPEDDFSGTLVSCQSQNKMQEVNTDFVRKEVAIEYDPRNISPTKRISPEVKVVAEEDSSGKLQDSHFAAQNASTRAVKVPDDTNSSSNSSMMKCEGISELGLKNSQLDSQLGDMVHDEFDFLKNLEDGSVTVNEFLTYFGAKFVIHRSRPSALPDNFRGEQAYTMEDLLQEKYIHRPKQKVYETDCQHLSELAEGFKTRMADQDKSLRSFNGTLLKDISAFSEDQLQRFGSKLKMQRGNFRKRNKTLSHKMKKHLYAELLKTTQEAKENLMSKLDETNQMLNDLDGCINDLESELDRMNIIIMGAQHFLIEPEPAVKAKQEQFDVLNSEVIEKEQQICRLKLQVQSLEETWKNVKDETRQLEYRTTNLNSLNEWRVMTGDENGMIFSFLHDTVQLKVQHKKTFGNESRQDDAGGDVDTSFQFLLNDNSQPSAVLVHKLLAENIKRHCTWKQKYSTAQSLPMLLHDVSVVVSRLRLLGDEIHRMKRWGGLRLGILNITCVDTVVDVMFSSTRAFVKFELSLAVSPDYPFRPVQLQKFQNHIGDTRLEQIKDILSSVRPAKNYLTTVMKRIHSNLLG